MFTTTSKFFKAVLIIGIVLSLWLPSSPAKAVPLSNSAGIFSSPLGYSDGVKYGSRYTYDTGGVLIENTDSVLKILI